MVVHLLQHSSVLTEVTSYLTLPELLELRVVSTELRSLVDSDDLWERRFLANANPLTKAILFSWIQHVARATEAGLSLLRMKGSATAEASSSQDRKSQWVFMPTVPVDYFINTITLTAVRDGMLQRLKAELLKGHLSVVFTASYWPAYLPLLTSNTFSESEHRSDSGDSTAAVRAAVKAAGGSRAAGGRKINQLGDAVFVKLYQANNDISVPIANSVGFDRIRQILLGRRVVVECLAAARLLRDVAGMPTMTLSSDSSLQNNNPHNQTKTSKSKVSCKPVGPQPAPKNLQDLFSNRTLMETAQPFFSSWKAVYQFFLEPFPSDHPLKKVVRWFRHGKNDDIDHNGIGEIWNSLKDYYVKKRKSHSLSRSARKNSTAEDRAIYQGLLANGGLTPGIPRTLADCQFLLLLRSRGKRVESDWKVCLLWLSGVELPDWKPFLTPLVKDRSRRPRVIFPPFNSGPKANSQVNFQWRVVIPVAIAGTIGLNAFHDLRCLLSYGPILVAVAALTALGTRSLPISRRCTRAEGSGYRFFLRTALRHPVQSLHRLYHASRELFIPIRLDTGFSPLASINQRQQIAWSVLLAFERWKHNLLRLQVHGVLIAMSSFALGLTLSFVSLFVGINDYHRKVVTLIGALGLFLYLKGDFREKTVQFTRTLFQAIRVGYPPTEDDSKSCKKFKRDSRCGCFACVTDQRAPPPVVHFCRQVNDLEDGLVPNLTFGVLLLLSFQLSKAEPCSFWFVIVDPLLLWIGSTTLTVTLTSFVNAVYWWAALR